MADRCCGSMMDAVTPPLFVRWFSSWLKFMLTVLLALGPFLHAHYGASHVSGLHIDGTDVTHVTHHNPSRFVEFQGDVEDESAALGVATSYPRELQFDLADSNWISVSMAWVLFFAGALVVSVLACAYDASARAIPRFYASGTRPPTLAPPL